jgi:CO dehydrogenase nickel-insertion accessory protein CooC1
VRNADEEGYIRKGTKGLELLGVIPYDAGLVESQMRGEPIVRSRTIKSSVDAIYAKLTARPEQ